MDQIIFYPRVIEVDSIINHHLRHHCAAESDWNHEDFGTVDVVIVDYYDHNVSNSICDESKFGDGFDGLDLLTFLIEDQEVMKDVDSVMEDNPKDQTGISRSKRGNPLRSCRNPRVTSYQSPSVASPNFAPLDDALICRLYMKMGNITKIHKATIITTVIAITIPFFGCLLGFFGAFCIDINKLLCNVN